jgi:hypothetical protein
MLESKRLYDLTLICGIVEVEMMMYMSCVCLTRDNVRCSKPTYQRAS